MTDIPFPEAQGLNPDPEVVAHSDGEESEEDPCGTFQISCSVHWGES